MMDFIRQGNKKSFKSELHYITNRPDYLQLTLVSDNDSRYKLEFFMPDFLKETWYSYLNKGRQLEMKEEYFSRIYIFNKEIDPVLPFIVATLDKEWLNQVKQRNA